MTENNHDTPPSTPEASSDEHSRARLSELGDSLPTRAAMAAGAGAAAIAGVSIGAASASASPETRPAAIVQAVGNQPVSSERFLQDARVSASTLLKMRGGATVPNTLSKSSETKDSKDPSIRAEEYTANVFDKIKNRELKPMVAFNGIAVLDSNTPIYRYIDPWKHHFNNISHTAGELATYNIHGYKKGAQLGEQRPIWYWDGKEWWIGVTPVSSGTYISVDRFRDATGSYQPARQATDYKDYRWAVYDQKHIKLYEYTSPNDTPNGKATPFIQLSAMVPPDNNDSQYYLDHGLYQNFVPGNWTGPNAPHSRDIASWMQYNFFDNKAEENDGGRYSTPAWIKAYVGAYAMKPYKLPSSHKAALHVMLSSNKAPRYNGTD